MLCVAGTSVTCALCVCSEYGKKHSSVEMNCGQLPSAISGSAAFTDTVASAV